ncbi:GNAT family N-acetyltransferase [Candidatus Lokiarchaeum ossiferum]|uniref:GNAT family N-acetyltransferase n=1 Tax=Candidatus Lokiarchaeum ossiferum TaxID=2951803 RepID=UPI00352D529C
MENLKDAKAVSKIVIRCLKEINSQYYPPNVINSMIENYTPKNIIKSAKEQLVLVAENIAEEIVGMATFSNDIFGSVFVNPDYHGQKIGAKLMKALEKLAKKQGSSTVTLNSSINAVNFYIKQGYTKGKEIQDGKFGKSIQMTKTL